MLPHLLDLLYLLWQLFYISWDRWKLVARVLHSGRRVAVFGLHSFRISKLSDYISVPIKGEKKILNKYCTLGTPNGPLARALIESAPPPHNTFTKWNVLAKSLYVFKKKKSLADVKVPENFNLRHSQKESHDFAMAILERDVTFTGSVRPVCIPRQVCFFAFVLWGMWRYVQEEYISLL